ncbi:MAG: inosine/xanthosine triphosphatase [Candidatus Freyarchaeota archaeon]|nr:inosine/xanthosine triphosphatase [Candidatus Freyrarchaeum guaymaensis]
MLKVAHMLTVAVGSQNPVKVDAVRSVMGRLIGKVKVTPVKVDPKVPSQPIGVEQTLRGAINRASLALEKTGADLGVGIEAGLIEFPQTKTGYMDFQYCAITDREGWTTLGCGPGFEYPPHVIQAVFTRKIEVGVAMMELTGIKDLGRKQGAIGYLTHGVIPRKKLTEISVIMAMIPRINKQLYTTTNTPLTKKATQKKT